MKLAYRWLIDVEFLLATRVLEGTIAEQDLRKIIGSFVVPALLAHDPKSQSRALATKKRSTRSSQ